MLDALGKTAPSLRADWTALNFRANVHLTSESMYRAFVEGLAHRFVSDVICL